MNSPSALSTADRYVFLLGRPPIAELVGFVRTMTVDGHNVDNADLVSAWRVANNQLRILEISEAGIADNIPLVDVPHNIAPLTKLVQNDPVFQKSYAGIPTRFAMVELDRLVIFQKFINLSYVEEIRSAWLGTPSELEVAELAFGIGRSLPTITVRQAGQNAFQMISPSNDLRLLGAELLSPAQVTGFAGTGIAQAFVVMAVGFGCNHLNVIQVGNRLVLNNGSHRAYALRASGITHVPCVVQQVSSQDEFEFIASGDLVDKPECYLTSPRPPILRDYFDSAFIRAYDVPQKHRLVQVQIQTSVGEVPAR